MEVNPWDLIVKPHSSKELAQSRYEICKSCDFLTKNTKQCKKCWCFTFAVVKIADASCPINKW